MLKDDEYDFETVQGYIHEEHFNKGRGLREILKEIGISFQTYKNAASLYSSYIV